MSKKRTQLRDRHIPLAVSMTLREVLILEKYCLHADIDRSNFLKQHIKKLIAAIEAEDIPLTLEEEQLLRARTRKLVRSHRLERVAHETEPDLMDSHY